MFLIAKTLCSMQMHTLWLYIYTIQTHTICYVYFLVVLGFIRTDRIVNDINLCVFDSLR